MMAAVDHVQPAAPPGSEERLRGYCVDALGMTEIPKPPVLAARGGCWFQAGTVQLQPGHRAGRPPREKAHPGLRVTGIDAHAARLKAHGAPVTRDGAPPGHRRFFSEDPVGDRLEFLEPCRENPEDLAGVPGQDDGQEAAEGRQGTAEAGQGGRKGEGRGQPEERQRTAAGDQAEGRGRPAEAVDRV